MSIDFFSDMNIVRPCSFVAWNSRHTVTVSHRLWTVTQV